jgi:hypothetical protein
MIEIDHFSTVINYNFCVCLHIHHSSVRGNKLIKQHSVTYYRSILIPFVAALTETNTKFPLCQQQQTKKYTFYVIII